MFWRWLQMVSLLMATGAAVRGQSGVLRARSAAELVNGYELRSGGRLFRKTRTMGAAVFVTQIPLETAGDGARLVGVFDFDGDGQEEVFLSWTKSPDDTFVHHFQVYRIHGQEAVLLGHFEFEGGPVARIAFYQPQGTADTPKTIFEVMGGAKWGTWYLLSPDGKSTRELGRGSNYEFIDLEKNGVYSLIAYKERPFEPVCTVLGYMGLNPGLYPEVSRKDGAGYTKGLAARRLVAI